jgi:hypothetical protein
MTSEDFFRRLKAAEGVRKASGADDDVIRDLTAHIKLPAAHLDLLKLANGIAVFGGYFRLFGYCSATTIDVLQWNASQVWKFAWDKPLDEFWFFGETAWGDQYAYRRDELNQSSTPNVWFLEGITMNEEVIARDFDSFLENEFLRNAIQPYDENIVVARRRLGDLQPVEHIAYVPSPLITGEENVDSVSKLDAVASMIIAGDLCNQLGQETQDRTIKELQPYKDSNGRMRMRVLWS